MQTRDIFGYSNLATTCILKKKNSTKYNLCISCIINIMYVLHWHAKESCFRAWILNNRTLRSRVLSCFKTFSKMVANLDIRNHCCFVGHFGYFRSATNKIEGPVYVHLNDAINQSKITLCKFRWNWSQLEHCSKSLWTLYVRMHMKTQTAIYVWQVGVCSNIFQNY